MKQTIQEKLTQISLAEPLHFLLAAESGSRAWGFASPDSDYDVRAIYIRPQEHYLQIDEAKDTFEFIENQWFDVRRLGHPQGFAPVEKKQCRIAGMAAFSDCLYTR